MTDILAGNTITHVNPFWAKWKITDGITGSKVRPAAYKTGTTSDNKDVHAYGYLAMPSNKNAARARRRRLDGQLRQHAQRRQALARHVGAAVVGDPVRRVQGHADRGLRRTRPKGLDDGDGRRVHRHEARGDHAHDVEELFIPGTAPTAVGDATRWPSTSTRPSGLRWREGCVGPMVTASFVDYSRPSRASRSGRGPTPGWQARAARGPGVAGGPKGTRTAYFYGGGFYPFGRIVGRRGSRRRKTVSDRAAAEPDAVRLDRPASTVPDARRPRRARTPEPGDEAATARRGAADAGARPQSRTIVAPSPPSPRSPARNDLTSGCAPACARTASRSAPVPRPWMIDHLLEARQRRVVQVAGQRLERLVHPGAAQVQRRGDGPRLRSSCSAADARRRSPPATGRPRRRPSTRRRPPPPAGRRRPARGRRPRPRRACRPPRASRGCRPSRAPRSGPPSRRSGCAPGRPAATSGLGRRAAPLAGRPLGAGSRSRVCSARATRGIDAPGP